MYWHPKTIHPPARPLHPKLHPFRRISVPHGAASFRILPSALDFCVGGNFAHNAGVVGSSPTPAIDKAADFRVGGFALANS